MEGDHIKMKLKDNLGTALLWWIGWVALAAILFYLRQYINVLYFIPILILIKWGFVNFRFAKGYADLRNATLNGWDYLPFIMENAIFSPKYAKATNIIAGFTLLMAVLVIVLMSFNITIPWIDFTERESFIQNFIYVTIFVFLIYNVVVGMGYLQIDFYIDKFYLSYFSTYKLNFYRRWNIILYFVPILRMLPMIEASSKCDKLTKFFNYKKHQGRGELV